MEGDINKCNSLLVSKYPPMVDVKYVIAKAFHLQNPLLHPQPSRNPFKFSLPYLQEMSKGARNVKDKEVATTENKRLTTPKKLKKLMSLNSVSVGTIPTPDEVQKMIDLRGASISPQEMKVRHCYHH